MMHNVWMLLELQYYQQGWNYFLPECKKHQNLAFLARTVGLVSGLAGT